MNHILPERRARKRTSVSSEIELVAGDTRIPGQLLNISFAGFQGRVAPGAIEGPVDKIEAVRLEGLPMVGITVAWTGAETFGATFNASDQTRRVIAGFLELFVPPQD